MYFLNKLQTIFMTLKWQIRYELWKKCFWKHLNFLYFIIDIKKKNLK